jgi:flagella basal body P-ring formation protein FlgA
MRVTVWQKNQEREIDLRGTALEAGRAGEAIAVRAGLRGTILRGIVRGPASVELTEKGR